MLAKHLPCYEEMHKIGVLIITVRTLHYSAFSRANCSANNSVKKGKVQSFVGFRVIHLEGGMQSLDRPKIGKVIRHGPAKLAIVFEIFT